MERNSSTIVLGEGAFRFDVTPDGIARLEFLPGHTVPTEAPTGVAAEAGRQLAEYLAGRRRSFDLPVDLSACSPFQRQVLQACAAVPAGETCTYAELARRLGSPGAARAVGHALARNPVPILIPCHRVLRGDGGLGGYIAGLGWKRRLLRLEGVER